MPNKGTLDEMSDLRQKKHDYPVNIIEYETVNTLSVRLYD